MGKKRFENSRSERKLSSISEFADLFSPTNKLSSRSKFNFSYLDINQKAGSSIDDLTEDQVKDICKKLKEYGQHSLQKMTTMAIGGASRSGRRGHILKFYPSFPPRHKTNFMEPSHTPTQVVWGCFRLSGAARLAGFVIPPAIHNEKHATTECLFDKNTFYVVFLDMTHQFWRSKN